ncbi:hypothetical protein AB0B28_21735 [Glycomyces sp. NPDC046736]|uniref:hypothetical protein n=1 Tax=Glycomyces sp. NPDC046736 TaxID=3155615 RepID=UPI0033DB9D0C
MTYPFASKLREELMARGLEQGRAEGRAKGLGEAVVRFLSVRGVTLSSDERARIEDCVDVVQLETWLHRAATARTASDVFEVPED